MTSPYAVADTSAIFSPALLFFKDLIASNLAMPDLYDPGALIYLGNFSSSGGSATIAPGPHDTLRTFSGRYGCPPAALLYAGIIGL